MVLRSIRGRIVAISILLVLFLFAAAFYTQRLVNHAASNNQMLAKRQQEFADQLTALKSTLYTMENGLYQYAVLIDESQRSQLESLLGTARTQVGKLQGSFLIKSDPEISALASQLAAVLRSVDTETRELVGTIADLNRRFPASPILTQKAYPANLRFITAVEDALAEAQHIKDSSDQEIVKDLLKELRYQWSQQISIFRVYLANRSGVFGIPELGMRHHLMNRENYLAQAQAIIARLEALDGEGRLELLQSQALAEMKAAFAEFGEHADRVARIYQSGLWRADIPILRSVVRPQFERLWDVFNQIESRLAALSSSSVREAIDTAGDVSRFLWLIAAFAGIILMAGVLSYELVIRRPIYQVIHALEALARGTSYSPLFTAGTTETERLLEAFREMQHQVYTREMRLASILDNASEGIITVNAEGVIEKFNNAAESLFGYSSDEVIGCDVSTLMPHSVRDEHKHYMHRYLSTGEKRVIGHEINVTARRKDGNVFPLSIKLSEMVLDGQRYFTAIVSDISERKAMLDRLRHLAEHDSLTGLYNRQYFGEELERVVDRALRQKGLNCALLYVDLDNFKYVNDTLGHLAGDQVLVEVGGLLTKRSRRSDLLSRLGGDEFAVLLYEVTSEQALQAAEVYRQTLAEYTFRNQGRIIDVGCSIGVAMLSEDLESKDDLMARADLSCHMAKRAGRNRVHLYEADDRANVAAMQADMGWARIIKEAIEKDRFVFALQPIVDIVDGRTVSYEVLLRMRGEDGEIIMPTGFMPSAERFGLVLHIDRWVVPHAIALLSQEMRREPTARFSINLSAMAIGDQEVLRLLTEALRTHRIDPQRVVFEITETIAIADLVAASEFLERLRALGCKTALDDFGVGYCSFAYLKDLPVDYVKIDGSFVRDIGTDALQRAMVKSMNEIAHAMGKKTVAEYVEDERILGMLEAIGVDYIQGYLAGHPRLVEEAPWTGGAYRSSA